MELANRSSSKPTTTPPPCRLREWRLERGLTLEIVSDLTGRDIAQISRLERGHFALRPMAKVDFARRLGARVGELFPVERS
jgi:transcriptional regulator with XRE-family HTH domain